jgi:hypothetical protein
MYCSKNGSTEGLNEPLLGLLLGDSLELSISVGSCSSLGHSLSSSGEDDIEVKSENTSGGIIFNTKIDVFINSKSEVSYYIK